MTGRRGTQSKASLVALTAFAIICMFISIFQKDAIGTCISSAYFAEPRYVNWFDQSTVIFLGWGGFMFGQFGWFANITAVLILFNVFSAGHGLRIALMVHLALILNAILPVPLAHNEGYKERMCLGGYGPGFYFWVFAMLSIALLGYLSLRQKLGLDIAGRE